MAKKLANDYRLWIESVTPGTYNIVKGQQDLSVSRNTSQIDTTTKDDYPYGTSAPGNRSLSVNCSIIPDLPDATGYTRLETQANLTVPVATNFQIRKNGAAGNATTDVVLTCSMYIGDLNDDYGANSPVKKTFTLTAAAAPTVDTLA